jgi:hypothetical protein
LVGIVEQEFGGGVELTDDDFAFLGCVAEGRRTRRFKLGAARVVDAQVEGGADDPGELAPW